MPRGRKRKIAKFVPQPWIHNSSSEDEPVEQQGHVQNDGKVLLYKKNPTELISS